MSDKTPSLVHWTTEDEIEWLKSMQNKDGFLIRYKLVLPLRTKWGAISKTSVEKFLSRIK